MRSGCRKQYLNQISGVKARPGNSRRLQLKAFRVHFWNQRAQTWRGSKRETGCVLGIWFKSIATWFWMAVRTQKEYQVDILSTWKDSKNKCQSHWNTIITMWICLRVMVHLIQILHLAVITARNFRRRCKKPCIRECDEKLFCVEISS